MAVEWALAAIGLGAGAAGWRALVRARRRWEREAFIRTCTFPRALFEKFARVRPGLGLKEQQLVARALRQFFLAFLKSGCRRVAMPSKAVDEMWHEFILFTREYQAFCARAFGEFLHHTPAVKLGDSRGDNEGLRRVWWFCCIEENINPRKPTRLPLLFAIDRKLGIPDGLTYALGRQGGVDRPRKDEGADAAGGVYAGDGGGHADSRRQFAESFSDTSIDGTTDGFSCSGGGDGGGAGCGSGCGGSS
jgi:hypothetical protein